MNGNETVTTIELTPFEELMHFGFFRSIEMPTPAMAVLITAIALLLCAVIAYLIGSLNVGIILSRWMYKQDIRELGSKNAGATNMARVFGGKAGILTILGEFVKTGVALFIARLIYGMAGMYVAALFAVLGQIFPIFYRMRGGKGVAATAAVMLFTSPLTFLAEFVIFAIMAGGTKYISLASIMSALLYPVLLNSFTGAGFHNFIALIIAILVIWRHKENIKRLWNKEERKFNFGEAFKSSRRMRKEAEAEERAALKKGNHNNGE